MRAISCLSFIFLFITSQLFAGGSVKNLKTEHLVNPLGIDASHPRFTWQLESDRQGTSVKSYTLVVGADSAKVGVGNGNTTMANADGPFQLPVVYDGIPLQPFTKYFWSVRVQDETGEWTDWAVPASFETGMMDQRNWKGGWITDSHDYDIKPAPWFRKEFSGEKKIASARAYIAVAGLYELTINGRRVGDHRLDPMYTRFDRRNLYVTHDVTDHLQSGSNVIGVLLGNGWYNHQ